ncbi:PAS domain S-box protein [bacterium]|nr:PAS domain S-box protein [bacterium]
MRSFLNAPMYDTSEATPAMRERLAEHFQSIYCRTDRMFAVLIFLQWLGGIVAALVISPRTWAGAESHVHPHLILAIVGGGVLASLPIAMALLQPGRRMTRYTIACSQVLFSSLLIHLSGGRIETHFHVFVSLAFLAAYRDPWVLAPATLIVALDHLIRGIWWPESVFGVSTSSEWRWLEHAGWVVFEVVILLIVIRQSVSEMRLLARNSVELSVALKKAEEGERLFREGFSQAAIGMAVKRLDGTYLRVNDRYCEMTGYSEKELFTKRFQDITHADDILLHSAAMEKLLSGVQSSFQIDKRYIHKLGHDVWVRLTLSMVLDDRGRPDHLIAAAQDITEERASQEQIAKLSLVASKTRHSVIISGSDGSIQWVNEGFVNLTGFTQEEALGRKPGELLQGPGTDPATKALIRERVRNCQAVSVEILNYHKNRQPYWISLEIDPVFDRDGKLTYFVATQSDISERKKRAEELEEATRTAETANRAKSQFLANMSHEIRTPLNGILGFTEVLLRDRESMSADEVDEYLGTISRSGKHLHTLINDVLDLSKIEADQLQVEAIRCSPDRVLCDAVSVLRVAAMEKGIGLDYRWDSHVPEAIVTDPYRLKQLLLNLIGNAIKFTDQGAVVVVSRIEEIANESELVVEVRDTGIGIPPDKLTTIFSPFTQADNTVTRKYGGTGLGLTISQRIAEALGGGVSVQSTVGQGSTFTARVSTGNCTIEDGYDPTVAHPGADVRDDGVMNCNLESVRVLVVDDGDTNRKLIRLLLERNGAKVRMAENGQIALNMAAGADFDLILMDMQMPVLDGYSATARLREQGFTGPIIALTANAMTGDREKCEQAGCSGYLSKPVEATQLYAVVNESRKSIERPVTSREPIRSLLPTDDAEIREIVQQFCETLELKYTEMEQAWSQGDMSQLAQLAHWLKGAAGTVGFGCFTSPAADLEKVAMEKSTAHARETLKQISELKQRLAI